LNNDSIEIEDDLILDVVDIMSQSYLNITEEETKQDEKRKKIHGLWGFCLRVDLFKSIARKEG
jgi:hypothetical protein